MRAWSVLVRPQVALATCSSLPDTPHDDLLLQAALAEAGVGASIVPWDDPSANWRRFDVVILRSTWNYHLRFEQFMSWLNRLELSGVPIWNRPALLRWNATKHYLADLRERGIPIVPTRWITRGARPDLMRLLADEGWDEVVVKPAVSAGAHRILRASRASLPALQDEHARAAAESDLLVQPFLPEIARGEMSLIFFGATFSHAVLKFPAHGDFRVQRRFGGWEEPVRPAKSLICPDYDSI